MRLEITMVAGSGVFAPVELSVTWPPGATCSGLSLQQALDGQWPGFVFTVAGHLLGTLQPAHAALCNGAVVVAWPADAVPAGDAPATAEPASAVLSGAVPTSPVPPGSVPSVSVSVPSGSVALLVVCSGPAAGTIFTLRRGSYSLGRGRCRLQLPDPALSRHHGTLVIGSARITLTAVHGSSGFLLHSTSDGPTASAHAVKGTISLETGQRISCGNSQWELRLPRQIQDGGLLWHSVATGSGSTGTGPTGTGATGTGSRGSSPANSAPAAAAPLDSNLGWAPAPPFGRGAAFPSASPLSPDRRPDAGSAASMSASHVFPVSLLNISATAPLAIPQTSRSSRASVALLLTGLLPLLMGTALAMFTGSMMFLAFAAMGAVTVLVPLLGGSKRRRSFRDDVARAVVRDAERAERVFPDAATIVLNASNSQNVPPTAARTAASAPISGSGPGAPGLALRVGLGSRSAHIVADPPDPGFTAPRVHSLPFVVPLSTEPLIISGPAGVALSLLNFVLMQLDAATVPVVVLGTPDSLPWAARFLPHTELAMSAEAAQRALTAMSRTVGAGRPGQEQPGEGPAPPCVLLIVGSVNFSGMQCSPHVRTVHVRMDTAGPAGPSVGPSTQATVQLQIRGPTIVGSFSGQEFTPDGVTPTVFAAHARRRAQSEATQQQESPGSLAINFLPLPDQCTAASQAAAWAACAGGPLLPVLIGQSSRGPTKFSFHHDGPHLLVGGTTGSGKSEFLRALVGSLAASHSPADLQFVFIDFKGGAGLGALEKLPHTSSLVTDLGGHGMDRTLASLRAELHRREAALSAAEVADSYAYRIHSHQLGAGSSHHAMAHLVIVVDEFRVLVDQFPDALAELMRIAAVGRSLGIHLVMATQRPQGAVNADIRANVTSSICLRVQSGFDSVDVIGSSVAANIAVDTPGRAYISRAGGRPEEFQSAVLGLPATGASLLPTVERTDAQEPSSDAPYPAALVAAGGVEAVAALMSQAWINACRLDSTLVAAPAVVAPELPAEVDFAECGDWRAGGESDESDGAVTLGILDLPEQQCLRPLRWHPVHHSHLACFGTGSEPSRAVALVAGRLLAAAADLPEAKQAQAPLLYMLDADASLRDFAASQWVGSYLTTDHLRTAEHLIHRLSDTARNCRHPLVLCITDWGRWITAFRSSPWHEAEERISELVRFGGKNLTLVVGGARELLTAGFMAAIPNRMYLSHGSPAESTMLWPRLPAFAPLPGRAGLDGAINSGGTPELLNHMHVAQLGKLLAPEMDRYLRLPETQLPERQDFAARILRVAPLPDSLPSLHLEKLRALAAASSGISGTGISLVLGWGGDGEDPIHVRLEPGAVLPVVGGPQTGKSSFLRMLAHVNGANWLDALASNSGSMGTGSAGTYSESASFRGTDPAAPRSTRAGQVLLLDNPLSMAADQLHIAGEALTAGAVLIVALPYPGPAVSRLPLEWGLRTTQQGVFLRPQKVNDAELFGVRLDTAGSEPPGRAALIDGVRREWFQFPQPEA
ncbi:FtsK/SpoIIIE domain-containing protein [Arthrobacter sp. N199823]|uniref:FtsK/SpoIIIE domain-containing protein n=1 Tax=Arthrobacter sp. N199823 TaxID=2058895 RepID=UPI0015E2E4C8|nr:FtsK/SpoIIIE domain-containing protein [Arthrobacter sp. N199823]